MTRWVVDAARARRAAALHGLPPRLQDARPARRRRRRRSPGPARIALANGLRYVYTGNVHDEDGGSTVCHAAASG